MSTTRRLKNSMKNLFELIGRYFLLMGKVFSKPEKASIYGKRILAETESLGKDPGENAGKLIQVQND